MNPESPRDPERSRRNWTDSFSSAAGLSSQFPRGGRGPGFSSKGPSSSAFAAIVAEFTARWERGEGPHAEEYVERLQGGRGSDVIELVYHEFCLAEALGLDPDPSDFLERFPAQCESLQRLFQLHGAFASGELREWATAGDLPEVDDEVGPYHLLRELGRGSFARVYLAEQADLDHRLVVVKISTRPTPEPRLLARARHSHIVEVLWHGTADDGALQLIVMPFLGGATLATVLAERQQRRRKARSGLDLLGDLDRVSAPEYPKANLTRPAREIIEHLSYSKALAWMGARLAEALDHAFSRGVAHGDIKPSNILLTADGSPMLLDFNLAVGWRFQGTDELPSDAGGTLAYMPPERLRTVAEPGAPVRSGFSAGSRHRADIFSLGVVLLEALTGRPPDLPQARARTRQEILAMLAESRERGGAAAAWLARSSVPASLRPVLARCLAADPADRYRRAAELAEDLDRWRTDRPLAFAEAPPWSSRFFRWARTQRLALAAAALALIVGVTTVTLVWNAFQTSLRAQAEDKLALIWDRDESGAFRFNVMGHERDSERGSRAENALHQLDRYDVIGNADWLQRDDVRALSQDDREELEAWLLEQVLRYVQALADRPDSRADWQRGKALLERVVSRTPFGPLETLRRKLAARLNLSDGAGNELAAINPSPRWIEEYLLGIEAESNRAKDAQAHYENVLKERPNSFWGRYRAATVAYRLGDYKAAAEHLKHCIARRPNNPALRSQLAACLYYLGRHDAALDECNYALELDPDHAEATRTRTFIRGQLGQLANLEQDLDRLSLLTQSQDQALSLRLNPEFLYPQGAVDAPASEALSRQVLASDPDDIEVRARAAVNLARSGKVDEALVELDAVIERDADYLSARYYRAMFLRSKKRSGASADFAFLVNHPRFEELLPRFGAGILAYEHHSVDEIRAGRIDEAIRVAQQGVIAANRFGQLQGRSHFGLARAYAAKAETDPRLIPQVAHELKEALRLDPSIKQNFNIDSMFDTIRGRLRPLLTDAR